MSRNTSIPVPQFVNAPLHGPAPGMEIDDFDSAELFRQNASGTNEGNGKLQGLLSYLMSFEENKIIDQDGYAHTVLSKRNGEDENSNTNSCLRPLFIRENKKFRGYFGNSYLMVPGGHRRALVPIVPKFNKKYLNKLDPEKDSQLLTNGTWNAYLVLTGNEAEIFLSKSEVPPPIASAIGDATVWNVATFSVEGSNTDKLKISNPEYFTCPFLPTTQETAHPFFPFLYQKKTSLTPESTGPADWYFIAYYGNIHDIHTGEVMRVQYADNKSEKKATVGETWWVRLETDDLGLPDRAELTNREPDVQVFVPEEYPDATKRFGVYKFKAFEFEMVGERMVPRIYLGADIPWYRWLHENVGDEEGKVYRKFNEDTYKHEFRTLAAGGDIEITTMGDHILISRTCEVVAP